jgi:hypothetical protein
MLLSIILIIILVIVIISAYAQVVGAPPVPTPKKVVERLIALADIAPGQRVYDLGGGDGRLVFAAADKGADARGFEISPLVFAWALLRKLFSGSRGKIYFRDFLWVNLGKADIIFLYMFPTTIKLFLQKKFRRELRPGTKIISYSFEIPALPLIAKERVAPYGYIFLYQV